VGGKTHILPLSYNHFINLLANLELIYKVVPLPECLQRRRMLDAWPSPPAFPSSLVANPAQEAFEESYIDIAKALGGVSLDVGAVPSEWRVSISINRNLSVGLLIPLQLYSIKLNLGLGAVPSLP
jgi:hypothetical protein